MKTEGDWQGVWPVVATPFAEDGSVDEATLRTEVGFLAASGARGLVVGGVTSEAHKLTSDERRRIAEVVAGEVGGRLGLVVGCGESSFETTLASARHAQQVGATAAMVLPAFAAPAGPETVRSLFEYVASGCALPLILQDASFFGPGALDIGALTAIAGAVPGIAAVKIESAPSALRMRSFARSCTRNVALIAGQGGQNLPEEFAVGARAVFPGPGFPERYVAILSELEAGSRVTHDRMVPLLRFLFQSAEFAIACYKRILVRRGVLPSAAVRRPGIQLDAEALAELFRLCDEVGL